VLEVLYRVSLPESYTTRKQSLSVSYYRGFSEAKNCIFRKDTHTHTHIEVGMTVKINKVAIYICTHEILTVTNSDHACMHLH
jgi:hypothetical protein